MKIFLILAYVTVLITPHHAQLSPGSFVQYTEERSEVDMIEKFPEYHSYINWTTGELVTDYNVPITYDDPNIGRQMGNLIENLQEKIIRFTIGALIKIRISSVFTINNFFDRDENIRFGILSTLYSLSIENPIVKNSKIYGTVSFPFYGTNSITERLYQNTRSMEITNFLQRETVDSQYYDTLIIDTVMFPQFEASLMPRILDQNGFVIHSVSTVTPSVLKKQSPVHYVTSITEALSHPIRGKRVAYILPSSIEGTTDIVLFNSDVQNIYGQKRTLDNLRQGKVIIIKPQNLEEDID